MQICFWCSYVFQVVLLVVMLRLVLLRIISVLVLFSFSEIFLRWCLVSLLMWWFMVGELVKVIIGICGVVISVLLVFVLLGSMCSRLVGKFVFLKMCVSMKLLDMGVCIFGLIIIVLFVVSVGVIVCKVRISGKLKGEIILIMFSGVCLVMFR